MKFGLYCLSALIVYLANILYVFLTRESDGGCRLAFWNMIIKLVHIPFYLLIFLLGAGVTVVSLAWFFTLAPLITLPLVIIALAVIDYLLLVTSSMYGIRALLHAGKRGTVSIPFLIVNGVLHFIFVADVISSILVFRRLRKRERPTV